MPKKKLNVLISAGGTGGHIVPAQKLGHSLLNNPCCNKVIFSAYNLTNNPYFEKSLFTFFDIASSSLTKKKPFFMISQWLKGFKQSCKILKSHDIDVVVGFGSYYTFPMMLAAKWKKIPLVLFEPNCILGKVNRLFAKNSTLASLFPLKEKSSLVSLSTLTAHMERIDRKEARKQLCLEEDLFTILIFGGSQGAVFLNKIFSQILPLLQGKIQVIHLTGKIEEEEEKMKALYQKWKVPHFVKPFEKKMAPLFSSADLAICRSGAATMAELIFFDLPAILIPYPYATDGHQTINAKFFAHAVQGGLHLDEKEITAKLLEDTILQIRQKGNFKNNIQNYKNANIAASLEELVLKVGEESL